jgi:[ribosomal protein S18]-alanine N-acetyltransferase
MKRDDAMAPQPPAQRSLVDMRIEHLDAAMEIERAAYGAPWTRGNFVDSLQAGCLAWCLFDAQSKMLGYVLAMQGAAEVHLLNLTVAPAGQGQGHARYMLDRLIGASASRGAEQVWLEVRASNRRARELYRRFGFTEVGLRKGYYPGTPGAGRGMREDAVAMSYVLAGAGR